jgi:hypothetical protein
MTSTFMLSRVMIRASNVLTHLSKMVPRLKSNVPDAIFWGAASGCHDWHDEHEEGPEC